MKTLRGAAWSGALVLLAASAAPADAAWCNAFQVCWHRHRAAPAPAVSYYPPPAPAANACCAPQPTCTPWYVQRCCQVPVTSYQQSFYWEPVTNCCTPNGYGAPAVAAAPQPDYGVPPAPG